MPEITVKLNAGFETEGKCDDEATGCRYYIGCHCIFLINIFAVMVTAVLPA